MRAAAATVVACVAAGLSTGAGRNSEAQAATPNRISAYFVMAASTQDANLTMLRRMKADAITFGYRVLPASKSDYPKAVQRLIGARRAFSYAGGGDWSPKALRSTDRQVRVSGVLWTVMNTRNRTVVISKSGHDRLKALNAAGNRLGAKTIVGLPAPRAGSRSGIPYLPDTSYMPTMAEFTKRFVADARAEGADGFYQHVEMPLTDTATWNPVRWLYAVQNATVNDVSPRALVIVSPYLESRRTKAAFTPAQAARGARMLLATAHGTRLIIAPQDGLGVGSTALSVDRATGRIAPLERYLAALRGAIGSRLWANVELMQPGPDGGRRPTTRSRVSQQLWTESHYVRGTIAFIWDDPSRRIGATYVRGGMSGFTSGFGQTGR